MNFHYYIIFYIFHFLKIDKISQIIPNLYLGNYCSLFLKEYDLVINCTKDLDFSFINCEKIRIPIEDNYIFKNNDILKYIDCLDKIDEYLNKNKKVLVFCKFGFQRSTTIILLYLLLKKNMDKKDSINLIKTNRPISYFIINNFSHILDGPLYN